MNQRIIATLEQVEKCLRSCAPDRPFAGASAPELLPAGTPVIRSVADARKAIENLRDELKELVPLDNYVWNEDLIYPVYDWKYEVDNDATRLGYWAWRASQKEMDSEEEE